MKSKYRLLPAGLWLCLIWTLSSLPAHEIPAVNILGFDKLEHIGVYCILMILVSYWSRDKHLPWAQRIFIISLFILSAAADEYHQTYIPGRSVSVYDLIANSLGIVLGSLIGKWLYDRR